MRDTIVSGLIGIGAGVIITALIFHYNKPKLIELDVPAIVTSNNTYVPERKLDAPVPVPIKQASKELKSKLVRAGTVTIEDAKPTVNLDWGLVTKDDSNRILFYTDDGRITGGVDIPLQTQVKTVHPKWTVGILVPIEDPKGLGPSVARHFGPVAVGVAAARIPERGWTGFATVTASW